MTPTTYRILYDLGLVLGDAKKSKVREAYRLADVAGVISAEDMKRLTPDPDRHVNTTLTQALIMLGCDFRGMNAWRDRGNRAA